MTKYAVTGTLLVLSVALLRAAEGGTMFQFNDQRFELMHAYAFQMNMPDFDAMSPEDLQAGPEKMKWKKALTIALSDQPFDTAALAKKYAPRPDLEIRMQGVALVGVFLRVSPFAERAGLDRPALMEAVRGNLTRFFGKKGTAVVDANLAVIQGAYDGVIDVTAALGAKGVLAGVAS